MWNSKWNKVIIGVGLVGSAVATAMTLRSSSSMTTFKELTDVENAMLARNKVLHVALQRLQVFVYPELFKELLHTVATIHLTKHATPTSLRAAEKNVAIMKRLLLQLRVSVRTRAGDDTELLEEYDDLAATIQHSCTDHLFNLHQSYTLSTL